MAMLLPTDAFIVNLGIVGVVWFGGNLVIAGRLHASARWWLRSTI